MEAVYLGLFAKLFNMVFEGLLKPLMSFLATVLKTIFSWVFNNLLKPLLVSLIMPTVKAVATLIMDALSGILFEIFALLLKLMEYLIHFFNIFSGLENVTYDGKSYTLLELLLVASPIRRAVWIVMGIGFVLIMMFSIIETVRSVIDLGNEVSRPVVRVLQSTFRGFIRMIMIPFTCLFLIQLSGVVMKSMSDGLEQAAESDAAVGTKTTIPRVLFSLTTLDAARDKQYNISSRGTERAENIGMTDALRAPFYYTDYKGEGGTKDYTNRDVVNATFEYKDIDYSIGFALGLMMIYILGICCFKFISRIFHVLILYVVSPLFAATIPLDEGKKFEGWKERFVGELFMGFGSVAAMQIYLLITPYVMDGALSFGDGSVEANALIRALFLLGGAYAVKTAGPILTGFISASAAGGETQADVTGAMLTMRAGASAYGAVKRAGGMGLAFAGKAGRTLLGSPYEKKDEKGEKANKGDLKQKRFLGGRFTYTYDKNGKGHFGMNWGKNFRFGMNQDGTYKRSVFGFSKKWDAKGNVESVKVPFVKWRSDSEGKLHVSNVDITSGFRFARAEKITKQEDGSIKREFGDMYCQEFSPLALSRSVDTDTGQVQTESFGIGGFKIYERGEGAESFEPSETIKKNEGGNGGNG